MAWRCYSAAFALLLPLAAAGCQVGSDIDRGDRLSREHRWTEAVEAYERALSRYPHSYAAAWGIARIYCLEVRLYERCLAWSDRLLDAYPDEPRYRQARAQGLRDRATVRRGAGNLAGAERDEKDAEALAP